jgi:hypothetical protein
MFMQKLSNNELANEYLKELKKVIKSRLELLSTQNTK